MMVRKVVIGSALGLGLGAMAFTGAGMALAGPGVSASINGGDAIGIGDQEPGTGAFASSTKGNNALAINSGFSPVGSAAIAQGEGNNVVAIDGVGVTGPKTARNNVVVVAGATTLVETPTTTPS